MKKRLESARRLMRLQDQKVRLVETDLARIRSELHDLEVEADRLHQQIDGTLGANDSIIDLLFRRLDQLARNRMTKQVELAATLRRLTQEKIRGEAVTRLKDDVADLVQAEDDKNSLLEIIERVGREPRSSFR